MRALPRAAVIARVCRQLQYGGALTGDQPRNHHDLSIREFERVVVDVRIVHVDLPESGNLVIHARSAERLKARSYWTFSSKANSVPGSKQTATSGSLTAAKPLVIDLTKSVATSCLQPWPAARRRDADCNRTWKALRSGYRS
jgi:hypothetical protein